MALYEPETAEFAATRPDLPWEAPGRMGASRAFARSLWLLWLHPRRFFRLMAVDGGLYEPLCFFWLGLGLFLLAAFPAALASHGLAAAARDVPALGAAPWRTLAAKGLGLALATAPLSMPIAALAVLGAMAVYFCGASLTGETRLEGALSAGLYLAGGALVLGALAAAGTLAACGALAVAARLGMATWVSADLWATGLAVGLALLAAASGLADALAGLTAFHAAQEGRTPAGGAAGMLAGLTALGIVCGVLVWVIVALRSPGPAPRAALGPAAEVSREDRPPC